MVLIYLEFSWDTTAMKTKGRAYTVLFRTLSNAVHYDLIAYENALFVV